ncbi:MAG: hypothetical protein RBR42_01945 [Desulfomicrobium sp.]|nr:hypothetical protein [Desulfomicrobium sp.]
MFFMLAISGCRKSQDIEGDYVYLTLALAGRLETLTTERGTIVEAKTLLFALETDYERHTLRQAEHELLSAQAQLKDMKTGKRPEEVAMVMAQLDLAKAEAANAAELLRHHETLIKSGGKNYGCPRCGTRQPGGGLQPSRTGKENRSATGRSTHDFGLLRLLH